MTDKTILQDARDLLAGGHSQWDPMDPEAVADIGVRLARVVSEHQKLLDKLKPILRTCACCFQKTSIIDKTLMDW